MSVVSRTDLISKLQEKKFRDAYVGESIKVGIAYQIRRLRKDRKWTQRLLGKLANKPQNLISRLEDPNYGDFSLKTLIKLAAAFDVALLVKYVPFSKFLRETEDLSTKDLSAPRFTKDLPVLRQWASLEYEATTKQSYVSGLELPRQLSFLIAVPGKKVTTAEATTARPSVSHELWTGRRIDYAG